MHARNVSLVIALALFSMAASCTAPQVTIVTQAVTANATLVAALAAPTCSATVTTNCLTAAQKADLLNYTAQADVFLGQATIVLSAGGTPTAMYATLVHDSAVLVQADTTGIPSVIAGLVATDAQAISAILQAYAAPAVAPNVAGQQKAVQFSGADKKRLAAAHAKVVEDQARIAGMRK